MEQLPDKIVKAVLLFENEQSDIDSSKVTLTAEEDNRRQLPGILEI